MGNGRALWTTLEQLAVAVLRHNRPGGWHTGEMETSESQSHLSLQVGDFCYWVSESEETAGEIERWICFRVVDGVPYVVSTTPSMKSPEGIGASAGCFFMTPEEAAADESSYVSETLREVRERLAAVEATAALLPSAEPRL